MLRLCMHYTLVSGATIIEQFLFNYICTFTMYCLILGSDGPIGFMFNLTAVDPNINVLDLHLAVADPRLEVVVGEHDSSDANKGITHA